MGLYVAEKVTETNVSDIAFNQINFLPSETNDIRSLFTHKNFQNHQTLYYRRNIRRAARDGGWTASVTGSLGQVAFAVNRHENTPSDTLTILGRDEVSKGSNIELPLAIKNFYTDGARRFYIEQAEVDLKNGCSLHIVRFYTDENYHNVETIADLNDPTLAKAQTFYWINEMGAGYLMARTDTGVITLQ